MMRYFLLLIFVFTQLFSDVIWSPNIGLCNPDKPKIKIDEYVSSVSCGTPDHTVCNYYTGSAHHYVNIFKETSSGCTRTTTVYQDQYSCPPDKPLNSIGVCETPPAPASCSWATIPPWFVIPGADSYSCNTTTQNGLHADQTQSYLSNAQWCDADSKCYGKLINCPTGTHFLKSSGKCMVPRPDEGKCPAGYYSKPYSTSIDGITKSCFIEYICRNDPSIRETKQVSCGIAPDQTDPYETPTGSTTDTPQTTGSAKATDRSATCGTHKLMASSSCSLKPRHHLVFECNPLTGEVTKSQCVPLDDGTKETVNEGDSTKSASSEDIKNLSNSLPDNIRTALKDFFTDGTHSHLDSIRGSLEASTKLDSDRNDKLDALTASTDASLVLQSDTNEKLDGIKGSVDGINTALNGGEFTGEPLPGSEDLEADDDTSAYDTFTNAVTGIQQSFDQATAIFSGGVPTVSMGSGSCPSYSFMGHSVSIASIGQSISPYSSIFSILIYIALMISMFRFIFSFLSRGV
jgi:hypothetical protein